MERRSIAAPNFVMVRPAGHLQGVAGFLTNVRHEVQVGSLSQACCYLCALQPLTIVPPWVRLTNIFGICRHHMRQLQDAIHTRYMQLYHKKLTSTALF